MTNLPENLILLGYDPEIEAALRSFLEVAGGEAGYLFTFVDVDNLRDVDLVIKTPEFNFGSQWESLSELPCISISQKEGEVDCLTWPVQWSEFKAALDKLEHSINIAEDHDPSVLVLETDSKDLWLVDENSASYGTVSEHSSTDDIFDEVDQFPQQFPEAEPEFELSELHQPAQRVTNLDLVDDQFWLEDLAWWVDGQCLLYSRPGQRLVYSALAPANWIELLQNFKLDKIPLEYDWQPPTNLLRYPITRLLWVATYINNSNELHGDLDENNRYLLDAWPNFDLLERDNVLIRLCAMLFTQAESVNSLASKSGYARSTIVGLLNACYQQGNLKSQ